MHNPRFMIAVMEHHKREHAHRNRHAWKRPLAPKPEHPLRRAIAALRPRSPSLAASPGLARHSENRIGIPVEQFRVSAVKVGGLTGVAVVGELEDATCDRLASAWAQALSGGAPVVLDLEACTFIDSMGLDLIVRTARRLHREGREMIVTNLRGPVQELFSVTGVESLDGLLVHSSRSSP